MYIDIKNALKKTPGVCQCNRCFEQWVPKVKAPDKPKNCARCNSPYWDKPRQRVIKPKSILQAVSPRAEVMTGLLDFKPNIDSSVSDYVGPVVDLKLEDLKAPWED